MPLVASHDPGNRDGKVHSHRFPAANTAVPTSTRTRRRLSATEQFLKSGFITVDIFAVSPVDDHAGQTAMQRRSETVQAMSTFAVGEEAEQSGPAVIREVGKVVGARSASRAARSKPGSTVRVDVVVRTRKIGHFFPGGTVDAFDVWLELQAQGCRRPRDLLERQRGRTTARARWSRARTSTAPTSSMARAIRSTSATPGRRAACSTCG